MSLLELKANFIAYKYSYHLVLLNYCYFTYTVKIQFGGGVHTLIKFDSV